MLHRRIPGNKTLDACVGRVRISIDVDIIPGEHHTVVATGRQPGSAHGPCGGISVATYGESEPHGSSEYHPAPSDLQIRAGRRMSDGLYLGRRRNVWVCYKCPRAHLSEQYDVYDDNPPDHALIFPVDNTTLIDIGFYESHVSEVVTGKFPGILEMPWEFCCYQLEMKAKCLDVQFKDPDMSALLEILYTCTSYAEFDDDSDKYYSVIKFINGNCDDTTRICDLASLLPDAVLTEIMSSLFDFSSYIEFEDEGNECARIENILRKAKSRLQKETVVMILLKGNNTVLQESSFYKNTLLPMINQGWLFKVLGQKPSVLLLVREEASAYRDSLVPCPDVLDITDDVLYSRTPNRYRCLELRPRWSRGIGPAECSFRISVKDRQYAQKVRCGALTTHMEQCSRMDVFSSGYCWQHGKVLSIVLSSGLDCDTSSPKSVANR